MAMRDSRLSRGGGLNAIIADCAVRILTSLRGCVDRQTYRYGDKWHIWTHCFQTLDMGWSVGHIGIGDSNWETRGEMRQLRFLGWGKRRVGRGSQTMQPTVYAYVLSQIHSDAYTILVRAPHTLHITNQWVDYMELNMMIMQSISAEYILVIHYSFRIIIDPVP